MNNHFSTAELGPPPAGPSKKKILFIVLAIAVIVLLLLVAGAATLLRKEEAGSSEREPISTVDGSAGVQFVASLSRGSVKSVKEAVVYLNTDSQTVEFIDSMQADFNLAACTHSRTESQIEFEGAMYYREILQCPYANQPSGAPEDSQQNATIVLTYKGQVIISVQAVHSLEDADSLMRVVELYERVNKL